MVLRVWAVILGAFLTSYYAMGVVALAQTLPAEPTRAAVSFDLDTFDFEVWMRSEQRRIHLLCLRIVRDDDEADTAAQDAFLKAYRHLTGEQTGVPVEDLGKWITRVAVNTCLDRLRSRSWKFWRRR